MKGVVVKLLLLSHAEAADSAVVANIRAHLLADPEGLPDAGAPFIAAVAAQPTALVAPPVTLPMPMPAMPVIPAPPIAPAAVAQPAPAVQPSPAAGERDKNGLPWDHRIHSSPPNKNKDGTWRQKRGTDPVVVAEVEAQLRQVMGIPAVVPAAVIPPAPPAPPVASVFAAGVVAGADPATVGELMMWAAQYMPLRYTTEQLTEDLHAEQVPNLGMLSHVPDKVPALVARIKSRLML